jgi:hypothetical protein
MLLARLRLHLLRLAFATAGLGLLWIVFYGMKKLKSCFNVSA